MWFHNCAGFLLLHVESFLLLFCEDLVPLRKVVKPVSLGIYHVLVEGFFIKCKVYLGVLVHGLDRVRNLQAVVDSVIAANPDAVARYKDGNTKLIGFFVGQCMKEMRGQGNPKIINQLLAKKLN